MDSNKLADVTSRIVSSFVGNNAVPRAELSGIIKDVAGAISGLETPEVVPAEPVVLVPAVPINKSITDEYIICLEDGKRFKMLRRHLAKLGMTPEQYRAKWGLPYNYPMVAKAYSSQRVNIAKDIGLGQFRRKSR